MEAKFGINILIEKEVVNDKPIFIVSSLDINVLAEGKTMEEAKQKFIEGIKFHLEAFPEEKKCLVRKSEVEEKCEMPMLSRVFL